MIFSEDQKSIVSKTAAAMALIKHHAYLEAVLNHYKSGDFLNPPMDSKTIQLINEEMMEVRWGWIETERALLELFEVHVFTEICHMAQEINDMWGGLDVKVDYQDYLKSEHWKVTRNASVQRASFRCQVCNSPDKLEVHHRTYERLWDELPEDLTVLCSECHDLFHKNGRLTK